jgi:hypothetical protein
MTALLAGAALFLFTLIIGGLIMTYEHIAIVSLLALQAATLFILYDTHKAGEWFRKAWLRDSAELLYWKRNGLLRHPLTGRYIKKDRR